MNYLFRCSIVLLLIGPTMAGCASSTQVTQSYGGRCADRGLQPGTDAFDKCVAQLETDSALRRDARHREMVERSAAPSFGR
jgi:hypothetical protein